MPPIDPTLLVLIAERPEDDVLWLLLANQLAEMDLLAEAAFVNRDRDVIRRSLVMGIAEVLMVRNMAKDVSDEAVALIDRLAPLLRREHAKKSAIAKVPPLPRR